MTGQLEGLLRLNAGIKKQKQPLLKKTVAFISGKGGTGKTVLAINVAHHLASKGKKVLIADMNFNFSNTAVMLNAFVGKSLYSFFTRRCYLKEVIVKEKNGIDFLFGDSGKADYPDIDDSIASLFCSQLLEIENEYDMIILDMASGAAKELFLFLKEVDNYLLVTSTEPTAIMDAYVMLKLLRENYCKGNKNVVINKCFSSDDGSTAFNNLNSANNHFLKENIKYLGNINFEQEISKSVINQSIFIENNKKDKTTAQIASISEKLNEIIQVVNINHSTL